MRSQKKYIETDDSPKIPKILESTECVKHRALHGVPCFWTDRDNGGLYPHVCNKRAKAAGFNAPINEQSLFNRRDKVRDGKRY